MTDSRIKKLADILVNYSIKIKKGDIIELNFGEDAQKLALECYKLIIQKGAFPLIHVGMPGFGYNYYKYASKEQLTSMPKLAMIEAKIVAGSIGIGAEYNTKEFTKLDPKKMSIRSKVTRGIIFNWTTSKSF